MKQTKFQRMSPEQLAGYQCRDEDECEALTKEREYREQCLANGEDYENEDVRQNYEEMKDEIESFWDDLDEDDRAGWTDNIIKSFDS